MTQENTWDEIAYLKTKHTKQLLQLRDACHKFNGFWSITGDSGGVGVHIDNVLAELNTREHVPAKKESKLLRKLMSQNKMTAEEVRAVPKFADMLAQTQYRKLVSKETYVLYATHAPDSAITRKMRIDKNPIR